MSELLLDLFKTLLYEPAQILNKILLTTYDSSGLTSFDPRFLIANCFVLIASIVAFVLILTSALGNKSRRSAGISAAVVQPLTLFSGLFAAVFIPYASYAIFEYFGWMSNNASFISYACLYLPEYLFSVIFSGALLITVIYSISCWKSKAKGLSITATALLVLNGLFAYPIWRVFLYICYQIYNFIFASMMSNAGYMDYFTYYEEAVSIASTVTSIMIFGFEFLWLALYLLPLLLLAIQGMLNMPSKNKEKRPKKQKKSKKLQNQ